MIFGMRPVSASRAMRATGVTVNNTIQHIR